MIDNISITEQSKSGRVKLQRPAFRYFSNPGARGTDTFKLSISGSALHIHGNSAIEVEVTSQ